MRAEGSRRRRIIAASRLAGLLAIAVSGAALVPHGAAAKTSWYSTCPSGNAAIVNPTLNAVQGGTATGTFKIHSGCSHIQVSLASYDAPAFTFALPQTLIDSKTGSFNAGGPYSFTVNVSPCFYQVDLVRGSVITNLTSNNLYDGRKLAWTNGGTKCVSKLTTTASDPVEIGGSISDSALLSGVSAAGGGTLTFKAYGPDDTNCSSTPAFTSAAIAVHGSNTYGSGSFVPTAAGTYRWTASYTGDDHNAAFSSGCNAASESVLVTKKTPTLATQASANITVGLTVSDTATLSGTTAGAGGSITFKLYGPDDATCARSAIATSTKTVSGSGTYTSNAFTTSSVGTYRWIASYSGDAKNAAIPGTCNLANESVTVLQRGPTITTTVTGATVRFGTAIGDTATLTGATATAGGAITFTAYGPDDATCGTAVYTSSPVLVAGNGTYPSGTFTPTASGTYRWIASYTGDTNNAPVRTSCNDANESVLVGERDHTEPTCVLTQIVAGPPKQVQVTVQDAESGIATIAVNVSTNAAVHIPTFSAGDTGSLLVTATKTDATKSSFIRLTVTNTVGLQTVCDPEVPATRHTSGSGPAAHHAAGLHLSTDHRRVVYSGSGIVLSGRIPGAAAGTKVTLTSRSCGFTGAPGATTARTGTGGMFSLRLEPGVSTTYDLTWQGVKKSVSVTVLPKVSLTRESAGRYRADVTTTNGLFLAGAKVVLQQRAGKAWRTIRTAALAKNSSPDLISVTSSAWFGASQYGSKLRAVVAQTGCYAGAASGSIKG